MLAVGLGALQAQGVVTVVPADFYWDVCVRSKDFNASDPMKFIPHLQASRDPLTHRTARTGFAF